MSNLQRALNVNKSVFIQACAGAGKTFALTKRYAAILDSFAHEIEQGVDHTSFDQRQILVITFTKKATGEMNRRIYKDVNTLLSGKKPEGMEDREFCFTLRNSQNENVKYFTKKLKDTFSRNAISTIDAFCANILREFAYKLKLDPQFLSQDEHDTKKLLNETLDAWIREQLKNEPGYFETLLEDLSFYQIKETLKSMYGSREVLDEYIKEFEEKPEDKIWEEWLMRYTPSGEIENLVSTFNALWENIQSRCLNKDDALYLGLKEFHENINELERNNPQQYRAFLISDIICKSVFVTKSGTYIKRWVGSKDSWSDNRDLVINWFENLKNTIAEEDLLQTPGPQDKKIIPLLKFLIKCYRDFDKDFKKIRMDRDLLDFSDVIILTHRLLKENKDVCTILGKRYRHIMLDEFQDTNPLRWQIIEMILNAGKDIKLFIVGDRKQSIYRFNNADVTVMNIAEKAVKALGGDIIDFNDNYRSSQKFIDDAINPVMREIMKDPVEDYEAVFEDTDSPRNKSGIDEPAIERIWCEYGKGDQEYIPAYHTAYHVKRMLDIYENSKIDIKQNEPLIGVLLRKGTRLGEYLQAFHIFNIPVDITGGKDFYKSQAVRDVFHLISVLDNPLDDHALIGLLRSPFFALPDPIIHKLADRGTNSVFATMGSIPELRNTFRDLLIWKEKSKTLPLDELITNIIDEDDRELAYVSELMPEQQLANFDKVVNIIRGLIRAGSSLREIREFLYYQIRTEADESQAEYPTNARVQILTVHKAKGLEFPIVIIPEMNSKGNSGKDKFRYGKHGKQHEITLSLGDEEKPGMLTRLKEITKNEEEAEDKRIFYVALTRAIHKVLLLGEGEEKALANSWWMKYAQGVKEPNKEDVKVENWTTDTQIAPKEMIMPPKENAIRELQWKDKCTFDETGQYLYRSPHDLMGIDEEHDFEYDKTGLGTAPGNIFHYCMEQGWVDFEEFQNEIKTYISERYAGLQEKELLAKLKPWLNNVRSSELTEIIMDTKIEKYAEHKVKGWLSNGKDIVQVNGNIDLLYKKDDQWVILDYKTDSSKRLLPNYKLQLQSYQWILKQVYGIDAQAKIYFASLDETVLIEWADSYFNKIKLEVGVKVQLPCTSTDLSKLIPHIKEGKQLILCASAQHEEQLYLAMAKEGILRPDIKISSLNKYLLEGSPDVISQDKLRLMIKHKNREMKNGTADLLAKALRDEELQRGKIKPEFRDHYKNITRSPLYHSAAEPYFHAKVDGYKIILLDVYAETELEEDLIKRLASEAELLKLSLSPDKTVDTYKLIQAFSPREEVLACAKHIKENCNENENVMIAVASMEKYAPHLQRQFPKLGLRARFIGPRSLYEFPCTTLLMNYLKLCAKGFADWSELAVIDLNPLMKPDNHLFIHDKNIRQNPMADKVWSQSEFQLCKKSSELPEYVSVLAKELKKSKEDDICKVCDRFLEILERVINDLNNITTDVDLNMVHREMSERIKKESIPRRNQWNGIPVVGLLDSMGVQADKLYVLGMVEGDIPRQEGDNPFFSRNRDYTLELNRHFMEEWKKLGDKVIFCTSSHAEDGSEQNRSSFLEEIKLDKINDVAVTRRDELLKYADSKIIGNDGVFADRHHEILESNKGQFSGGTECQQNEFDLSVTQVDKLLACPMKFYFETVMKSRPMDQDDVLFWAGVKGDVIHKAFELFINGKGYGLELEPALKLMNSCLDRALDEKQIDKNDPLQMDHFRNYVKGLTEASDKNCLAINLGLIKARFEDYKDILSEVKFEKLQLEHPGLDIFLKGRIDKIMINEEEKKLIASDFKTGSVTTSLLSKMMLSQLYLYLKYCDQKYPQYEMKAMYEKLKKPSDCGMTEYMEIGSEFKQLGKNAKQSFVIEAFEDHLNNLFSQIAVGNYYITEKDFNDACKNCPHESLCRKNTRIKQ